MKIAFIGAGNVGAALAVRFAEAGHDVAFFEGRASSPSIAAALARSPRLTASPTALVDAEVVFLAIPFGAVAGLLPSLTEALAGKVLIDCTNPVGPGLAHGLRSERAGSALVQELAPAAKVVKAFSIYGFENFEDASYPGYGVKPAMLFCGDDGGAKEVASRLIADLGFEPVDVGGLVQALHLEHMTLLWVRMVRAGGNAPGLTWGALRRR